MVATLGSGSRTEITSDCIMDAKYYIIYELCRSIFVLLSSIAGILLDLGCRGD